MTAAMAKQYSGKLNRCDVIKAYVESTHQKIVQRNIERLKVRRAELLYCSKRARAIPLHKQVGFFKGGSNT